MSTTSGLNTAPSFKTPSSSNFKTPSGYAPRSFRRNVSSSKRTITTPGTARTGRSANSVATNSAVILALAEGRGHARGDVGIACMGVSSSNLILCQVTDSQNYAKTLTKINIFGPTVILMSASSCDVTGQPSHLYRQVKKAFKNTPIATLKRRVFNDAAGLLKIRKNVNEKFASVIVTISQKYYALAAASALLKYMEAEHTITFLPRTLKIEFQGPENMMLIDWGTAHHLELFSNSNAPNSVNSLIGIVNNCRTPMGSRILRMNILQPPCHVGFITQRLDCVEELTQNAEFMYGLQDVLARFGTDLDQVIVGLILIPRAETDKLMEQRINFVIALKHVLGLLPNFVRVLSGAKNPYFQHLCNEFQLPVFGTLMENISKVINIEAHVKQGAAQMKLQRTFAVNADVNPFMDISRKVYCELVNDINQYVMELTNEHSMSFRLCESASRGYHLEFTLHGKEIIPTPKLPSTFLQVHRSKNVISFTTDFLLKFERRTSEILQEIHNISVIVISKLIVLIREDVGSLYQISEAVSNLDILHSFAVYALQSGSVRPQFSNAVTAISESRHPILGVSSNQPVPNSTFISNDANVMLITGPNMSGKTTYLKQVASLQILAQIGSFVPAKSATFRIADCIFSRIGTGDSIEENVSSFEMEMAEMNYILTNVSDNSLVIIDELGRATSVEEGTAMSWAMTEALLKSNAFVLLATHYLFLTRLESIYLNVLNYKMDTQENLISCPINPTSRPRPVVGNTNTSRLQLHYTHLLCKGVTDVELYGLKMAGKSAYLPRAVSKATDIAYKIMEARQTFGRRERSNPSEKLEYLLASHMMLISTPENRSARGLTNHLTELQVEMQLLMEL